MRCILKLTTLGAAFMAGTALVQAADMVPPPVVEVIPEVRTKPIGGWYLRGDIGYAKAHVDGVRFGQFDPATPALTYSEFSKYDTHDTWMLQGGVGYQVNDYFRVDATYTRYNEFNFDGRSSSGSTFDCSFLSADDATPDTCSVTDDSAFSADVLMMNAYLDLGNYAGFTPYVGGGIGGAHVSWNRMDNDVSCDSSIGNCLNGGGADYNTLHDTLHNGADGWRFAWSLHAGASYDLTHNLKLDAGYTFTRIEGGAMFEYEDTSALAGSIQGEHGDIDIHAVRAGIRWNFH